MMKTRRLKVTLLSAAVWLTSWGLWLTSLAAISIRQTQQVIVTYLEESPTAQWFEDRPFMIAGLIASWLLIHNVLRLWQRLELERDRRDLYQAWGDRWNWVYHPKESKDLWRQYGYLHGIPGYAVRAASEHKRYPCVIHALAGQWRDYEAKGFTYYSQQRRRVRSSKSTHVKVTHYYLAVTLIHVDAHFPKLYLRRLHWSGRVARWLKLWRSQSNIFVKTLEREHRGRRQQTLYRVEAADRIFAEQFLSSSMMDCLMSQGQVRFEIDRDTLVLYQQGRLNAATLEANLEFLHRVFQHIPRQWKG